jgi:hypothetical protein
LGGRRIASICRPPYGFDYGFVTSCCGFYLKNVSNVEIAITTSVANGIYDNYKAVLIKENGKWRITNPLHNYSLGPGVIIEERDEWIPTIRL